MPGRGTALEEVLESISDAFVALDRDWRYTYVNRRAGEVFGRPPEDLVGKHIWTEFPEGVGQTFYDAYHRALAEGVFVQLEDYYPPWDRWFENRIYPTPSGLSIFFQDITARKKAELALVRESARRAETEADLRRSEARLRALVDGSTTPLFVKDLEGRYVLVNSEVERMVGRDHTEIEGRLAAEVFPPTNERGRAAELEVAERDVELTTEERVTVEGVVRTYLVKRFPLHDEDGKVAAVAGIATDITERAAAEAALRERERQLAEAQRIAQVGSFECDLRTRRVDWSEELYRIYGLDPASFEPTIETFVERVHPEDRDRIVATVDRAIAGGGSFRAEERVVRPTGEVRHLATWGEVLRDEAGTPVRLAGICHDVTEEHRQRQRGEALRDVHDALTGTLNLAEVFGALLDSLLRFVPGVRARILLLENDGELIAGAARGYDRSGVDDTAEGVPAELAARAVREGRTVLLEARPDGGSWMGVPLRAAGEVTGLCAIESAPPRAFTGEEVGWAEAIIAQAAVAIQNARLHGELRRHAADLERRVAERTHDLSEAKEEAERANRAKSDFLAGISHELRTPMNAILGFAQLLEIEQLTEEQADNVQQILRGGRHLLHLITELLDIARIEAGELALSLEPVGLAELVGEALDLVRPLAEDMGVETAAAGDLSGYVLADRQRARQVLLNLLSNGVKYNRRGGRVEVGCTAVADGRVALAVRDTGPGIAPDDLDRLFVPFDRLGLEGGTLEGAGLGLALAKRLVEAMGGSIRVTSAPGEGSVFTLVLPRAEDPLAHTDAEPVASARDGARSATILYIEDNAANLKLVERALARQPGIDVVGAADGRGGLELARDRKPDLVLLDLHLPDISGEEVLDELRTRRETRDLPVVVISAAATKARVAALERRGIDAYLTKPIDLSELLEAVREALGDGR